MRPFLFETVQWETYVELLEEKFAPTNICNYQIHVLRSKKQQPNQNVLEYHSELHKAYQRARYSDEHTFYDQFLKGCINKQLVWEIIRNPQAKTISGLRQFLIESQATLLDAGKYLRDPKFTVGLSQLLTATNQYIQGFRGRQSRQDE